MHLYNAFKTPIKRRVPKPLLALVLYLPGALALATNDPAISGRVTDHAGRPVVNATVMVYHAGPVTGYSLFCPSCYVDCGKRTLTDKDGRFVFRQLGKDLWFELLVAKSGYQPRFVAKVIPTTAQVSPVLERRRRISEPSRVFRGKILDDRGLPQRDAIVQPSGALWDAKKGSSMYGVIPGLDPIAVTDSKGVFEIDSFPSDVKLPPSFSGPPLKILISTEARGMAEKFGVIPSGNQPQTIAVSDGAIIRGRLVKDGKPVAGAEIGLIGYPRGGGGAGLKGQGSTYEEMRIGTRSDGAFEIDNVPTPGTWYVYAKMESVAKWGATGNVQCATTRNDEVVELGDLELKPGYRLRGKVVLSDGTAIPNGMRVTISASEAFDSQTVPLPPTGQFEFAGLAAGTYSVFASVKGYSPVSSKAKAAYTPPPAVSIKQDIDDFTLTLRPDTDTSAN